MDLNTYETLEQAIRHAHARHEHSIAIPRTQWVVLARYDTLYQTTYYAVIPARHAGLLCNERPIYSTN